jgi:hypothetical protein
MSDLDLGLSLDYWLRRAPVKPEPEDAGSGVGQAELGDAPWTLAPALATFLVVLGAECGDRGSETGDQGVDSAKMFPS